MSDTDPTGAADPLDESLRFAERLQAEIAAEAERLRREDPEIARAEREIERAWAHVAPPGAVGEREELLLDRAERLAMVDVDAPLGAKPGVRQVKGAIRKGTYWYLRYMSDQLNAFHNVQVRLLRRLDERIQRLEESAALAHEIDGLVAPAAVPGRSVGTAAAAAMVSLEGPVVVASCGVGESVAALTESALVAYGVDADPAPVLAGIDEGRDLRAHDPVAHLRSLEPDTLGGVVLGGALARVGLAAGLDLLAVAGRVCRPGGVLIVAPESGSDLDTVDAALLRGRMHSIAVWARLCRSIEATTETVAVTDPGIDEIVIARLP